MKFAAIFFLLLLSVSTASAQAEPYTRAKEWEREIGAFLEIDRKQTPPRDAVLFVGSSTIRMWTSLREDFPQLRVINRGFGGSRLEDLVFFAPKIVAPYKPRTIVVYSGENDIEAGQPAENVLADFKAFVAFRDANLPRTPVVYLSMKPSILRWRLWPEMKRGNDLIAAESRLHKRVVFVDLARWMLGADGKPMPDIFLADNLHLNARGYAILRDAVRPHLN